MWPHQRTAPLQTSHKFLNWLPRHKHSSYEFSFWISWERFFPIIQEMPFLFISFTCTSSSRFSPDLILRVYDVSKVFFSKRELFLSNKQVKTEGKSFHRCALVNCVENRYDFIKLLNVYFIFKYCELNAIWEAKTKKKLQNYSTLELAAVFIFQALSSETKQSNWIFPSRQLGFF